MNFLPISPVIISLLIAVALFFCWGRRQIQRAIAVVGTMVLFITALLLLNTVVNQGVVVLKVGSWPAPFGIVFAVDLLGAIMVMLTCLVGLAVIVYSLSSIDPARETFGYYPMFFILLMGINGSFITGDVFNLYVWFEVMLISSFVLLVLGGEKDQLEGTLKYVTLNLLSSAIFLAAIGLLYGVLGTLNMADLAVQVRQTEHPGVVLTIATMFFIAFGIKAAVFPVFSWLPASYHTPPAPVSAVFAGLLTKVGVYTLIRFFTLIFVFDDSSQNTYISSAMVWLAGLTMVFGILGALSQTSIRRILSFNLISHIGFMLMGLGLMTSLALAGAIFYIIHDIIVKTTLFLVGGLILKFWGTETLAKLGGLYKASPVLAILFFIPALALSGIPPLSGFWPKLALIQAGLNQQQYWLVAAALLASLLTLYSMTQIWSEVFWKKAPSETKPVVVSMGANMLLFLPVGALVGLTVLLGLFAEPVFSLTQLAAEQLLNPEPYIQAVLGDL